MSARGFWIVALVAALAVLAALNLFRSEEQVGAGANAVPTPLRAGQDERAAPPPVGAVRGSSSAEQRADATGAESRDAPPEPQAVPVSLPTSGPYASISAALADRDVPPERRIQPPTELLETERAFAAESADPGWSTAAEAGVLAGFAEIPGLSLVSLNVECRTTLCLLQLVTPRTPPPDYPNPNIAEIAKSAGLKSIWQMGIRVRSGAPVMLAYLERVGTAEAPADAPAQ